MPIITKVMNKMKNIPYIMKERQIDSMIYSNSKMIVANMIGP
jgi:hypothetical protein